MIRARTSGKQLILSTLGSLDSASLAHRSVALAGRVKPGLPAFCNNVWLRKMGALRKPRKTKSCCGAKSDASLGRDDVSEPRSSVGVIPGLICGENVSVWMLPPLVVRCVPAARPFTPSCFVNGLSSSNGGPAARRSSLLCSGRNILRFAIKLVS